jgi:hypothetical protein
VWITEAKTLRSFRSAFREKRQQSCTFAACGTRDTRRFEKQIVRRAGR